MARGGVSNIEEIEIIDGSDNEGEKKKDVNDENNQENNQDKNRRRQKIKFNASDGDKTLEKLENLNLSSFDTQHLVDPLFRKTTKMFDEMSMSTLMSSQLSTTPQLLL